MGTAQIMGYCGHSSTVLVALVVALWVTDITEVGATSCTHQGGRRYCCSAGYGVSVSTYNGQTTCSCDEPSYTCTSELSTDNDDGFPSNDDVSNANDNYNTYNDNIGSQPTSPPTCVPVETTYTRTEASCQKSNTCEFNCSSSFTYQQFRNCSVKLNPTVTTLVLNGNTGSDASAICHCQAAVGSTSSVTFTGSISPVQLTWHDGGSPGRTSVILVTRDTSGTVCHASYRGNYGVRGSSGRGRNSATSVSGCSTVVQLLSVVCLLLLRVHEN
eukprot:m.1637733 g.1637733  ORF g.1637733 m.1637733 type:complete len:272 (+) comp26127_c0_seq1:180-995(+)